ncbi:MAG: RluA family pseudouridine synthase [Clostridiales bacterium]|nr:RluA family pseudouridine synthase [Clostridiales bacterium]
MKEIAVSGENENSRLDKFLFKYLNRAPKSLVYKLLRKKNIKLGGKKACGSEILKEGDIISLFLSDETLFSLREEKKINKCKIDFDIVYEDSDILIADKPFGMLTQADKTEGDCLNRRLLYYMQEKGELKEGFVPSVCNRLDRNTAGLVTFGKTLRGARELSLGFREHFIEKYYFAAVKGVLKEDRVIRAYHKKTGNKAEISSSPSERAKETVTEVFPITNNGRYTLLRIKLVTGKTHQIRAALAFAGYPTAGDTKYGDKAANGYFMSKYGLKHQLLYCGYIEIKPENNDLKALKPMKIKGRGNTLIKNIVKFEFGVDLCDCMC